MEVLPRVPVVVLGLPLYRFRRRSPVETPSRSAPTVPLASTTCSMSWNPSSAARAYQNRRISWNSGVSWNFMV